MQGATPVNGEFEVGFDQIFENQWYRAELVGRAIMIIFVACGLAGLLGRGPYSHRRAEAAGGGFSVDYEPVARAQTSTTVTLHVANRTALPHPVTISLDQKLLEPMGLTQTTPLPNSSAVTQAGIDLRFVIQRDQPDALIRLQLQPNALGPVPLRVSDGDQQVAWTMFVVP
jgi:hypothetical protein